jgi:hypothetical protein
MCIQGFFYFNSHEKINSAWLEKSAKPMLLLHVPGENLGDVHSPGRLDLQALVRNFDTMMTSRFLDSIVKFFTNG